jgi:hypothetical protein
MRSVWRSSVLLLLSGCTLLVGDRREEHATGDGSVIGDTVDGDAPSPATSTLVAIPGQAIADGSSTIVLVATLLDESGNPVGGRSIVMSATGSANTFSPATGTTDSSGVFATTLASTKAEMKVVTATIGGIMLTVPVTFNPGNISRSTSTVVASPTSNLVANGSDESTVTVTITDANGNPIASQMVSIAATGGGVMTPPSGSTNGSGVFVSKLTAATPGVKTVTAMAGTVGLTSTPMVTFVACYEVVTVDSPPPIFTSIASVGTKVIKDTTIEQGTAAPVLPFNFKYFGVQHTAGETLTIYQSGYVAFGSNIVNSLLNVCPLPTSNVPAETIMPYWSPLESRTPTFGDRGTVWVTTQGSAPNRKFVVEWNNMDAGVPSDDSLYECIQISIQLLLDEATGQIEFRYQPQFEDLCGITMTPDPNFAVGGHQTIGLQSTVAVAMVEQVSCNTADGPGPEVIGTCTRPGGGASSTCTANKGYLFKPKSTCP